jgi:hypothetical protein
LRNVIVWEIVTCGKGSISGASEFTLGFYWDSCYSIFSFMCMFYRSLFALLSIFFWPLHCMFFFDLRILITPLVSSNPSWLAAREDILQIHHDELMRWNDTCTYLVMNQHAEVAHANNNQRSIVSLRSETLHWFWRNHVQV